MAPPGVPGDLPKDTQQWVAEVGPELETPDSNLMLVT